MANFLTVPPSQRTLIPGDSVNTAMQSLSGDQYYVRQSNSTLGDILRLSYSALTDLEVYILSSHYFLHGVFYGFDLPAEATQGATIYVPSGYLWRYRSAPELESSASSTSASVDLILRPPSLT